jgi:hypothetical protein
LVFAQREELEDAALGKQCFDVEVFVAYGNDNSAMGAGIVPMVGNGRLPGEFPSSIPS